MYGIHGTTIEISKNIRSNGFKLSSTGRAGSGVYFWRYFDNNKYAKYLALEWWKYSKKAGDYNAIKGNMGCCYITVKFNMDNFNTLDLSHGIMREIIRDLILTKIDELKNALNKKVTEEEIISSLFDTFIKQIEIEQNIIIDAIITNVPPPKGSTGAVGKYVGSCAEAIILTNLNMIEKINYSEESQDDY